MLLQSNHVNSGKVKSNPNNEKCANCNEILEPEDSIISVIASSGTPREDYYHEECY